MKIPILSHPCQNLLLFIFVNTATLKCVKLYLIVVLICIFLMVNDTEPYFHEHVGHFYIFYGEKSIQNICPLYMYFAFCYWTASVLDIFCIMSFITNVTCKYLHPVGCSFHFLYYTVMQKGFKFDDIKLTNFFLWFFLCFWCHI